MLICLDIFILYVAVTVFPHYFSCAGTGRIKCRFYHLTYHSSETEFSHSVAGRFFTKIVVTPRSIASIAVFDQPFILTCALKTEAESLT